MILEAPTRISEALGTLLGPLGRVLGGSWEALGGIWETFGSCLGGMLGLGECISSEPLKY